MALEAVVFQQNPFAHGWEDYDFDAINGGEKLNVNAEDDSNFAPPSIPTSSPETCVATASDHIAAERGYTPAPPSASARRKRRRNKSSKNKEELENQRMTHIAVERNRRRLMNDYLAALRSLMPPSYAQRGDQASIVGGAINYVKELEQHVHFLEGYKQANQPTLSSNYPNDSSKITLSNFFTFPQYSTTTPSNSTTGHETQPGIADIEVSMVEGHVNVKILSKRHRKQLVKMVATFHSLCLTILHLNVTAMDPGSVLYSFNVKVEEECRLSSVSEIAKAVHETVALIQRD